MSARQRGKGNKLLLPLLRHHKVNALEAVNEDKTKEDLEEWGLLQQPPQHKCMHYMPMRSLEMHLSREVSLFRVFLAS